MGFCRSAVCVLILLLYLHHAVFEEALDEKTVRVFPNDSATLPCSRVCCIGTVSWIQNSSYVVAHCNASSCNSTEGYQMSYSDYLKRIYSLTIPAVTSSNTGSYICRCEHTSIQKVLLQIINTINKKVDLHDSAVLPCIHNCSGLAMWKVNSKSSDILAECNQTSCRSVKKGYQMIYNQYLQGNLSLIISDVDFSKRGLYTCKCDGTELNDTNLIVNTVNFTRLLKPGDTLLLELEVSDSVKVYFNGTLLYSVDQVCPVQGRSTHYRTERMQRSVISSVELRNISKSDSGVYIVRDTRNDEDIHIYTVTVTDDQPSPSEDQSYAVQLPVFIGSLAGVSALFLILLVGTCIWKKKPCARNACIPMNQVQTIEDGN